MPHRPERLRLPGGALVVTDELVELVDGDEAILIGVLGHELGHVRHRHDMRTAVQSAAIGLVGSLVFGDFSTVLAAVPVLLAQASHLRDLEGEADRERCACSVRRPGPRGDDAHFRASRRLAARPRG